MFLHISCMIIFFLTDIKRCTCLCCSCDLHIFRYLNSRSLFSGKQVQIFEGHEYSFKTVNLFQTIPSIFHGKKSHGDSQQYNISPFIETIEAIHLNKAKVSKVIASSKPRSDY